MKDWQSVQMIAQNPSYCDSKYYCISVLTILSKEQSIYPIKDYEGCVMWPFESIHVPVPNGYDDLLTIQYGDYMTPPPVEERGRKNNQIIFDTERPYTEYLL